MTAAILNVNPPTGIVASGGDEAKLKIQLAGIDIVEFKPNAISLNGAFWENNNTVSSSYTITANKNAMTAGPVTIQNNVIVTVPDGSEWTIV
jgi:hypothetical protein